MSWLRALWLAGLLGIVPSFAFAQENPSLTKEIQWKTGKKLLAEGKPAQAQAAFQELVKKYPEDPDLHLLLALTSLRLRDPHAAETFIRKALVLAPDHAEARTLLGWILLEVHGDAESAIGEYSRVVQLRPQFPEAHNNLGVAYRKRGDLVGALASLDRAISLRPDYGEAISNRGWVYLEQKKWREARSDFERALALNPKDEGGLYGLSQVLRETRDYAGAQEALKKLIAVAPNFVYWLEWGRIQLIRYYWVLLLVTLAFFLHARYRTKMIRRKSDGGGDNQET